MKVETGGIAIEESVGFKPKMYSFVIDNSENKNVKCVNKDIVAVISHNEHEDVFLNNKYVRQSMHRIQSKDHRIGTYQINKISLSGFHDKIYIKNNRYDGLPLGYQGYLENTIILITT